MEKRLLLRMGTAVFLFSFFTVSAVAQTTNLVTNGDLETAEPWFWNKYNEAEGDLTWATDQSHNFHRSLKISKTAASTDAVCWISYDFSQYWWNHIEALLYKIGGWYKTEGVNTNPTTVDEGIAFIFQFYKDGTPLVLPQVVPIDQTVATADWDTSFAYVAMPDTADSAVCVLAMGKDATGTVWFDDVVLSSDPWSGGVFNASAEFPVGMGGGWVAGADKGDYEYASDFAHSGMYSAKLSKSDATNEATWSTVPNGGITPGEYYKVSVWVKTDSVNTNENYIPSAPVGDHFRPRINLCFSFMRTGWETDWPWIRDNFMYINQVDTTTDWTEYVGIAMAPEEAAAICLRPRFNHEAMGIAWFDDLSVEEVTVVETGVEGDPFVDKTKNPRHFMLNQNYPNPFNPETVISYTLPKSGVVELDVYNIIGQRVRRLVNKYRAAGTYRVIWDGLDDSGNRVVSGVYFYQLRTGSSVFTRKMVLVR